MLTISDSEKSRQRTTRLGYDCGRVLVAYFCVVLSNAVFAQQPFGGVPRFVQPTLLSPDVINNLADGSDSPSISGDGLAMYYTGYPDLSKRATLWQATRPSIDADWETSEQLSDVVHAYSRQLEPEVTSDGLELYFRATDVERNYDWWTIDDVLVVSTRASTDEEWGAPTPLPEIINDSFPCLAWPTITGDGLELYFAAAEPYTGNRCGGRSSSIYVSKRSSRDDAWGEPQLVEPYAWVPGISPDGLQLYFSDAERDGLDLFEPQRFPDSHSLLLRTRASRDDDFGDTVELGEPPNMNSASHAALSPDVSTNGETIYFDSNRPGVPSGWGIWETSPAELCDINADGSCNADDLTRRSLFRVNLAEGSESERDIVSYDISGDGRVDENDLTTWLAEAALTNGLEAAYFRGDSNLDGEFNSGDLVDVFKAGKYELATAANWADGDWTGDQRFDSGDLVAAFRDGGYELHADAVVAAVPEPSGWVLLSFGLIGIRRKPSLKP